MFPSLTGLCPDWEDWDPKQGKKNATEAMGLAEEWLEVPQVCYYRSLYLSVVFLQISLSSVAIQKEVANEYPTHSL